MKLSKKLILSATLCGMIAPLAACGGSNKTKVVFWNTMGKAALAILDGMVQDFEKANPDIDIIVTAKGGYGDIRTACENAIAAGDVPTMAYCYPDHVANYLTSNAVIDVTSYLEDPELAFTEEDGLVSDFIEGYWNEGLTYDVDGMYSVPFAKSTEVLFYNKSEFAKNNWKVPTTWDELEELCATIKSTKGYEDKTPFGYDSDSNLFITLCEQYGIPYTTNDNIFEAKDHFLFNNKEAKAMVERVKTWYQNGWFISQGTDPEGSYTSTKFKNGDLLMSIGSTGGTTYNYADNFEIGVARIPGAGAKGNNHVIMQGPSICFFRRQTPLQKVAAWKFYKYIVKADNAAYFAMQSGYSSPRKSSFETDIWKDFVEDKTITGSDDLVRRTVDFNATLMDSYFVSATFKGSSTARDEVGGIISTVCTGSKTVEEAFTDAYNNCVYAA